MINKSNICRMANAFVKQGHSRSGAFRLAWALAKEPEVRVAGVSFGKRPAALERLTHYGKEDIGISLERDAANAHDRSAVQVWASVAGKGRYCVGHIPAGLAKAIAPAMDAGAAVTASLKAIVGGWQYGLNYGLRLTLAV